MNNEKELIKQIIDQKASKQHSNSISFNQSSSAKKISLLEHKQQPNPNDKDHDNLNPKHFSSKNDFVSRREKRRKYSEDIKQSIENERRANLLNKQDRGITPKEPSSSATFCRSEKKRGRYYGIHSDYFKAKYDRYDIQQLAYQIEKEFSKVGTNKETFNERMEFYVAKQKIKKDKINELIEIAKPHIEEKDKVETFNRLILDANRRTEVKKCLENINSDMLIMNIIRNNQKPRSSSAKMTHEEWERIYKDRFKDKLTDRNAKVQQEIDNRKRKIEEEEKNYDEEVQRRKKVVSKEEMLSIANRLHNKNYRDLFKKTKEFSTNSHTSPTLKNSSSNKMYIIKKGYKYKEQPFSKHDEDEKANSLKDIPIQGGDVAKLDMDMASNKAEKIIDNFFLN